MSKFFLMMVVAMFSFLTAFACEDEASKSVVEEVSQQLSYDVELANEVKIVHNGLNQMVASFNVNVDTESSESVYVKGIRFQLRTGNTDVAQELAFYGSFSNFSLRVRGETVETLRMSAYSFVVVEPIFVYPGHTLQMDVLADVNTPEEALYGVLQVTEVNFGNTNIVGTDDFRWESTFDPNLGESFTAVNQLIDGWMAANWAYPLIRIENCNEFEVQLDDGSCVYDNCQIMPNVCGYGDCRIDLQDGRLFCDCDPGFSTTPGSDYPACNYRVARYDVEITESRRTVHNGSSVLLGEWQIYTTGGEASRLKNLFIQMEGTQESFSSFQVTMETCLGGGYAVFGELGTGVQNDNPSLPYSTEDTIDLVFSSITNSYDICSSGSPATIRVHGEVHGNPGDYLTLKVKSAGIYSAELFYEDGFPLGFEPDLQVGSEAPMTSMDWQFYGWDPSQYVAIFPRVEIVE